MLLASCLESVVLDFLSYQSEAKAESNISDSWRILDLVATVLTTSSGFSNLAFDKPYAQLSLVAFWYLEGCVFDTSSSSGSDSFYDMLS